MRTIKIYGSSDDLFEIEGCLPGEPDEFGIYDKPGCVKIAFPGSGHGLLVFAQYAPLNVAGAWMVGISQVDEDRPLPGWPMRWSVHERGYSVQLEIDVPEGVVISRQGTEA